MGGRDRRAGRGRPAVSGGTLLREELGRDVAAIVDNWSAVGSNDDPEPLHRARVGTRRLRSMLRTFGPLFEPVWRDALIGDLRVLADDLGPVRDLDVLAARLHDEVTSLPEPVDRAAGEALLAPLDRRRARARTALRRSLETRASTNRRERLVTASTVPALSPRAERAATDVLVPRVARAWRRLHATVVEVGEDASDADLHRVRILVKRMRYAVEVVEPAAGAGARRAASLLEEAQGVLGDHHDVVIAADTVRELATRATRAQALAAGEVLAALRAAAAEDRRAVRTVWDRLDRPRAVGWLP